jgi:hypothetical protein
MYLRFSSMSFAVCSFLFCFCMRGRSLRPLALRTLHRIPYSVHSLDVFAAFHSFFSSPVAFPRPSPFHFSLVHYR